VEGVLDYQYGRSVVEDIVDADDVWAWGHELTFAVTLIPDEQGGRMRIKVELPWESSLTHDLTTIAVVDLIWRVVARSDGRIRAVGPCGQYRVCGRVEISRALESDIEISSNRDAKNATTQKATDQDGTTKPPSHGRRSFLERWCSRMLDGFDWN
jgi:hypothetical protein